MSKAWKLEIKNEIAVLRFDHPDSEANILTAENLQGLDKILDEVKGKKELKAILFVSAKKKIFIAGADIHEIKKITTEKEAFEAAEAGKAVLKKIEDLGLLSVAVINGACVGGGAELVLACDARVASFSSNVKIGLPEVRLGILPGFGGSIRLPRLIGLMGALPLILTGKILSAEQAAKQGIVDKLFPEATLEEDAVRFAENALQSRKGINKKKRKRKLLGRILEDTIPGRAFVLTQAKKGVMKQTKGHYPAPLEIIELLKKTYGKTGDDVYVSESKHFSKLATTSVSKNSIKVFFLSEKFKKRSWTEAKLEGYQVAKCGVVGAGVMGGGIAHLVSSREIPVRVKDIQREALGGALKEARRIYEGSLKRRRIKRPEMERKMHLISVGLTTHGFENSDMVIEAVVENLDVKKKVFAELGEVASKEAILASNTSSLSVTQMAEGVKNPERVVGIHFFNPVNRMPLVEVIRAKQSSDETIEKAVQFSRRLGKTVIVVDDQPGFLVNRLLLPYMNEAAYLLEGGMSAEGIDRIAVKFGMPMGPIELGDQVGIDVGYKVAHILEEAFGERMKVADIFEKAYAAKLLGKKSGRGFYLYKGRAKKENTDLAKWVKKGAAVTEEDALKRMIYVMVNEAARCLQEKVAADPESVDVGMIFGTGFPPFRAGLLHFADDVGLKNIIQDLDRFSSEGNPRTKPSEALLQFSKHGGFYKK